MNKNIALGLALVSVTVGASAISAENSWSTSPAWASSGSNSNSSSTRSGSNSARKRDYNTDSTPSPFAPDSNNVALDVGQVFLMGDLNSKYTDNLGVRLHYTYGVSQTFGFDSSFGYSNHSDGKFSMTSLLTGVRANLSWYDKVIPYAVVGLGFYKPSMKVDNTASVSPLLFGVHLGPGVTLQLTNNLFFGAALTFHDMFGSNEVLPDGRIVAVDGTFASFFLNAGVSF